MRQRVKAEWLAAPFALLQYRTLAGLKTILDQLAPANPKAKAAKPQDFVDARLVEEFDKSGYIDSLYGRKK